MRKKQLAVPEGFGKSEDGRNAPFQEKMGPKKCREGSLPKSSAGQRGEKFAPKMSHDTHIGRQGENLQGGQRVGKTLRNSIRMSDFQKDKKPS